MARTRSRMPAIQSGIPRGVGECGRDVGLSISSRVERDYWWRRGEKVEKETGVLGLRAKRRTRVFTPSFFACRVAIWAFWSLGLLSNPEKRPRLPRPASGKRIPFPLLSRATGFARKLTNANRLPERLEEKVWTTKTADRSPAAKSWSSLGTEHR